MRLLTVTLAGGQTLRIPTVAVPAGRMYAFVTAGLPHILRWAAYDAAGHRLYGGAGERGLAQK